MIDMAVYNVAGIGQPRKFFDDNAYYDAINYILNSEKAIYAGYSMMSSLETAAEEMEQTAIRFNKNSGKRLRHSVLSFSANENVTPEQADEFAAQIIQHYLPQYQIVYAVHNNTDNLHIHFVMNQISCIDGQRYRGKKKDYYDFQRHMKRVTGLPIMLAKNRANED